VTHSTHATLWWREAVTYQIYVRSFADSDGDGVGDLPGITARLPYLRDLGVDALWVTPFYRSPQHDHGYDVADYSDIDPLFGSLADADDLIDRAHELDLRVIVDLVPNHTSAEHPWFQAALAAGPGSPERARYLFRDGRGPDGTEPPNNWESVFGGCAWDRVREGQGEDGQGEDGQWYLHLFDSTQPDLDWTNPEVGDLFEDVLRFWLDRGVDGFRVDVAHGLMKASGLPDREITAVPHSTDESMVAPPLDNQPMWDQPEVHEVYRRWHRILAEYDGDRMLVAEAWTATAESLARYVRADEMHQAFNFAWLSAPWSAAAFAEVITSSLDASALEGALPTWVLSNHDVIRHPTRYGGGPAGVARGRAATLAMLALPGAAYLYQGEELGLEQVDVAPEHRQDPAWTRQVTGRADPDTSVRGVGRDGCRVPIPWSGAAPPYGFGPGSGQPWIPQPPDWAHATVAAQDAAADSTLAFYREALSARREHAVGAGSTLSAVEVRDGVLTVRRGPITVVLNAGTELADLPPGDVVVASGALADRHLPPDTCVWLR
jgi:alpha-glucosidase